MLHSKSLSLLQAVLVLLVAQTATTNAQNAATADPYRPYYNNFRAMANPVFAPNPSMPNQARFARPMTGPGMANQMGGAVSLDDPSFGATPVPGRFAPYSDAFRAYDGLFGRTYIPNEKADQRFLDARQKRDDLFARLQEPNLTAQDRAEIQKQIQTLTSDISRELRLSPRAAGTSVRRPASSNAPTSNPKPNSAGPFANAANPNPSANNPTQIRPRNPLLEYLPAQYKPITPPNG